jgi:hypothetical protein
MVDALSAAAPPISMRILITSHEPLDAGISGRAAHASAYGLAEAGYDVRVLVVDGDSAAEQEPIVRRVLCHPADPRAPLRFGPPSFDGSASSPGGASVAAPAGVIGGVTASVGGATQFSTLSDRQLAEYRDVLREEFDRQIDLHDPTIVHCQHVWLFGHLALEAGVPYVLSAYGEEFAVGRADARYRRFMLEAAENAGRILTHDAAASEGVAGLVGDLEGRVVPFPLPSAASLHSGRWWSPLPELYRNVVIERFGRMPEA